MARMGSGESGAPGKPIKVAKPAAKKVVRKTGAPPKTDVQSSGGDYGAKKAKAYQRTPAAKKPVIVASKQLVRDINTGKTKSVIVKQPHLAHPGHDLLSGGNLKSLAAYFTGNQYTGQKPGLADTIHRAEDQTAKGAVYLGDTGKNIIRRLQGPGGSTNEASVFPAGDVAKRAAQNLPVDFANTMVNAIPAATHIGSEIAHGHVERAAKQLVQPYVDIAEHPGRNLVQHPFSTTMLITGPVRGLSRGVGAAARRGAFGKAAKSAASTSRESSTVPGTKLVHPREYSPDPVGKAVQVSKEKGKVPFSKERKAAKLNKQADQAAAAGNHEHAATLRHQASLSSPTRMSEDQVKRRVDEIRDTNEVVRRKHAGQVSQQVHAAVRNRETVGGKVKKVRSTGVRPTAAVSLVAQKITYPTVEDLRAYQSELAHEHATGDLTPSQRATNEQLRSQIQDALDHPQDMGLVQQAADKYLAVERGITQKLVGHRMIEPGEAAKRREMPFSSRFAGGSRDAKVRLTQAGTDKLIIGRRIEAAKANFEDPATIRKLVDEGKAIKKATKGKKIKQAPGWVDAQGRPLTAEQMRADREHGVTDAVTGKTTRAPLPGEAAYVSHMPNLLKPGSFYRDSGNATGLGTKHFTGGSVTKGTLDASEHALHASARRLQSLLDAHEGHLAYLDETAMRDKAGAVIKGDRVRVDQAIERATVDSRGHILPGARKWRVVRVNPFFGGRPGQLEELMNSLNEHGELHSNTREGGVNPVVSELEDALRGRGDGPFVAVPEEAVVRLEQHLRQLGNQNGQVFNVLTSLWRKNVLAFSPKWAASNIGEATERSLVAGVRPGDRALLVKTVDQWMKEDPAAADRFLATIGQGHYGMIGRNQRYATAQEFTDATRHGRFVRFAARLAGTIERTPVANWLPKVYGAYTRTVMEQMGRAEGQFRMAMAGKKLRDITQAREFADLSEKGVRQALDGLKGTPAQIQVARFTRNAFGQYEAFTPGRQAWIRNYTPFVPWAINAIRFLAVTLPRDHPIITTIAADLTRSQEPWLRREGLWLGTIDTLPAYELGDVPVAGGGLLKVTKYTPQSLMGDPLGTVAGLVLPQGQNIMMALRGLDAFGNPLRESKESAILKSLLGLVVPSPIAPRSTGSSGVLDVLNPVQVIPKSKVDYSRVKATLDRINNQITVMPQAEKTKRKDGTWPPKYAALLKQRSDLLNRRNVLLVKAGFKKDPAIDVEQKIRRLRVRADRVKNQTDEYGAHTKTYTDLRTQIRALEVERKKLLGTTKPKVRKILNRPLTTQQQIRKQIADLHKRDIHKEIQDEINRMREQEKVNRGG